MTVHRINKESNNLVLKDLALTAVLIVDRIKAITRSCIRIWESTVGGAYCKYLCETTRSLQKHVDAMEKEIQG